MQNLRHNHTIWRKNRSMHSLQDRAQSKADARTLQRADCRREIEPPVRDVWGTDERHTRLSLRRMRKRKQAPHAGKGRRKTAKKMRERQFAPPFCFAKSAACFGYYRIAAASFLTSASPYW